MPNAIDSSIWIGLRGWCYDGSPTITSPWIWNPAMNEDLQQLLQNLKLKTIAARFDEMLAAAEQTGTPVPKLFAQLLRAEWHARQEQALEARITRANFPEDWTLESSPFKLQKGVKECHIRSFAELEFIPKAENIVFIGETEHAA
jgi:DNA replication protein DnaC